MGPVHLLPHQMFLLVPSPSEVLRRSWGRKRGRSSPEQFGNQNNQMTPLLILRRFLKEIACKRWFLLLFRCASISWIHVVEWASQSLSHSCFWDFVKSWAYLQAMFRVCSGYVQGMFRVFSGYVQGTFRVRSGYVQGTFRVCSGYEQGMFRVCSEYVQSMFRVCFGYVQVMFRLCSGYV